MFKREKITNIEELSSGISGGRKVRSYGITFTNTSLFGSVRTSKEEFLAKFYCCGADVVEVYTYPVGVRLAGSREVALTEAIEVYELSKILRSSKI